MGLIPSRYKVRVEVFEGPLDLLLYLIKKNEVDIYDIPIVEITNQYFEYLNLMQLLDLDIAGEFLVMAATLMMIKSRMLLPPEERPVEEEEEDPRWELVQQLIEYKRFKDAAGKLQELEKYQEGIFSRLPEVDSAVEESVRLSDVSIFDLLSALQKILKYAKDEDNLILVNAPQFTVEDKMEEILSTVQTKKKVEFTELFTQQSTRYEIITIFLALLELIRLAQVIVFQEFPFGKIVISAV